MATLAWDSLAADLEQTRLLPLVALPSADAAVPIAQALLDGGVKFLEVTFRNEFAQNGLQSLAEAGLTIRYGAGTVRNIQQAENAVSAGALFLVTPGFNEQIVGYAMDNAVPIFPGVDSTLGIEMAYARGIKVIKMFPASVIGGPEWLKAIQGPYFDIKFIPTGGVTMENLRDYLKCPNVLAAGGSFLIPPNVVASGNYTEITDISTQALAIVDELQSAS
ncbi:MAG TPA: bifunctional 4-hydroxy-2-oxoglutarate aldolase/2-dehydro-3-deoxy-phosphogluconate aldolase [Candidatus Lokiarchaeia archaeon]|nr:bifunctional 4-hydroxy-2-oxoglutarate aldolase/2-dehydro-3-deoxy-phosphogluconate aldolase [Candidatus Lokiarchaeia archaeon]